MMITHHAFDVQVLDYYDAISTHQIGSHFMQRFAALIGNPFM